MIEPSFTPDAVASSSAWRLASATASRIAASSRACSSETPPPEALATPRRAEVRQRVPEGALGIGGGQASVNSVAAPSAWSYIGQTPLRLFDARRARPCLLAPGDRLRLRRIGEAEFDALAARARRGEILFDPETPA